MFGNIAKKQENVTHNHGVDDILPNNNNNTNNNSNSRSSNVVSRCDQVLSINSVCAI